MEHLTAVVVGSNGGESHEKRFVLKKMGQSAGRRRIKVLNVHERTKLHV